MAKRRRQASLRISWLAMKASNGIGCIRAQMPPGERKSGMPHSVEIPAPVNGSTASAFSIKWASPSIAVFRLGASMKCPIMAGPAPAGRRADEKNRYTLVFLAAPEDEPLVEQSKQRSAREAPLVELTYNWDSEDYGEARHFGHLAYEVDDIYATCEKLKNTGKW